MAVAVLGAGAGLVGTTGVVWVAFVVGYWIAGFALLVAVGAGMMVGVGVGCGGDGRSGSDCCRWCCSC